MKKVFGLLAVALATLHAFCGEWTLSIRNGACARTNVVIRQPVTHEWLSETGTHTLVDTTDGKNTPVPWTADASGTLPELVWLATGGMSSYSVRTYAWVPGQNVLKEATDLCVTTNGACIAVENSFFRLKQPVRGGGGFPYEVKFAQTGFSDPDLYFLDRIVRRVDGKVVQFCAKDCADAASRVVFQSPLSVTVEVNTGFGRRTGAAPGCPQAVYRYTYAAFSPVVNVSVNYTRNDDGPWNELHFLHLTRTALRYGQFVTGDPVQTYGMQPRGARSRSVSGPQWAVMSDGQNACGVGFDGALCWDASDEFVYYVRRSCTVWEGAELSNDGGLYFGPGGARTDYAAWLGRERQPDVRIFLKGHLWVPLEKDPIPGVHVIENDALRVSFAGAEKGFDCVGIENRLADDTRFVRSRDRAAGLWSLTF